MATKKSTELAPVGDQDAMKIIARVKDDDEGTVRTIRAMEVLGLGCFVLVTTRKGNTLTETTSFIPNAKIEAMASGHRLRN